MTIDELGKIASSYKWEVWHGTSTGKTTVEQEYYVGAVIGAKRGRVSFDLRDKEMPQEMVLAIMDYTNTKKKKRGLTKK